MSLETPNAFADEENILLHTALFKQVSPAEAEELLPHLKRATFDKGDYIFSEGDTDQRMYLLEQGRVKLIRTSVWLEHDALFAWLDEHPRVAIDMLQVMANRQRGNNERISDLVFMDVPARLAKILINLGSRFGEPVEQGLKVPHDLTQEELAQLVGSSRETVNKALMDFSNRGWIARDGRSIIIFQPGMLIRRSRR
ncbi:MAG: Crp/Fnr family transcriptional regulator [Bifidobacterium longum]|nr:Crp/Fnr family transcriptional regulator [Bifidobacterium longum]